MRNCSMPSTVGRPFNAALSFCLVAAVTLTIGGAAIAQEPKTVATVDEMAVTEADLALAAAGSSDRLRGVSPAKQRQFLVNEVVELMVVAAAAKRDGLHNSDEFKRQMAFIERRVLLNAYFTSRLSKLVTEEAIKQRYDEENGKFVAKDEVRARHILVKDEKVAAAVIKELDGGADFAKLAADKSIGPSKDRGGDLGYFSKGQMVGPFEDAVFALSKGEYSKQPVKTKFGFHVILLEDQRKTQPPTIESRSAEIRNALMSEAYVNEVKRLKDSAKIVVIEDDKSGTGGDKNKSE
jgi:peptidyl-prolyl cis-trans isomerase C